MATELEKMLSSKIYNANYDEELLKLRVIASNLCFDYNNLRLDQKEEKKEIINKLKIKTKRNFTIEAPFYCDYGFNIEFGENFYANRNFMLIGGARTKIGDNVFIGPSCTMTTAGHPLDVKRRNEGLEYAYPIEVEDNVWIGANVVINPGVKIGENSVIGSGSVVTKDIPKNCLAYGTPCKVVRKIDKEDELTDFNKQR